MPARICASSSSENVRTVPSMSTVSAMTLLRTPPLILPMVSTAFSPGSLLRLIRVWNWVTAWAAATMASMPWCGKAPCAALPWMRI